MCNPRRAIFILALLFSLTACAPTPKRVVLLVDGERRIAETTAVTVQEFLREQTITLGDHDKVEPPPFAELGLATTITITRVRLKTETVTQPLPFTRQLVRDETYPHNQIRVVQLGTNGTVAITYTITLEDGKETARRESGRRIVTQPKDEILALGTQGSLRPVALAPGTIVYLAHGNAFVMRNSSDAKRALTTTSDLDGRVFALSGDGRYLLFSRAASETAPALNSLWSVDTLVLGETPRQLPINDALVAQLSADARTLFYSTGEKTAGAPGWKAHNDLWMLALAPGETPNIKNAQAIWLPNIAAPYAWWGAHWTLAPDGRAIAYAFANEIGVIELTGRAVPIPSAPAPRRVLKRFAPFRAPGDWVWTPHVAWSPDSRYIVTTIHAPLGNPDVASDDPTFEVWALARDGSVNAALASQTGMWAMPLWSPPDARGESRIAFSRALAPTNSERSRYALNVMDRAGGNKRQIFPLEESEDGLTTTQLAWAPDARQLIAVRENDLWLYDFAAAKWSQLTANGASAKPQWGK